MIYILIAVVLFVLIVSYKTYDYAFRRDPKRQALEDEVPDSKLKMKVIRNIYSLMHEPFEEVYISSYDETRLYARYYHYKDGAPVAIIMHGYRSNYCRDGNGGFKIAKEYGMNILLPDQRAHGKSDGNVITFGIKERYDCREWVKYITNREGKDTPIVLVGLSMGAATVMMASDIVGDNVKGIVADCGFSSPQEIIKAVAKQKKIPPYAGAVFAKLGAFLFGRFRLGDATALKALDNTKVPVLFFHGDDDSYVPCRMSELCYDSCRSDKEILIVDGATHGMSYYVDTNGYTEKVRNFFDKVLFSV